MNNESDLRTAPAPPNSGLLLGFIGVVQRGESGYVGGLLAVDERGCPIEFWHTESEVRPTKLQELLYGKTLKPELLGRCIAGSLLERIEHHPDAVFTQDDAVMQGLMLDDILIFRVICPDKSEASDFSANSAKISTPSGLVVLCWREQDAGKAEHFIDRLADVDVTEPFERIEKLLDEVLGAGFKEESPIK